MSAVCMVRDYVEFDFDGPVVRALSDPTGRFADWEWQFPAREAPGAMRLNIGKNSHKHPPRRRRIAIT